MKMIKKVKKVLTVKVNDVTDFLKLLNLLIHDFQYGKEVCGSPCDRIKVT